MGKALLDSGWFEETLVKERKYAETVTLWLLSNVNSGGRYITRHTVCTVGSCGSWTHQMPDECVLCDEHSPGYKQIRARVLPSVNAQSRRGDRRAASTPCCNT